ncbi:MAG: tetratricopeptide repeat protein [Planctomycetes bacterium]|nr:tetratricopeptide repeat protein [Planctomycetota bacterium]
MSEKSQWVFDVTEAEFEEKVIKKSHEAPIIVDFWAPRCPPCRVLGPILERMTDERKGEVLLAKVDVDEEPGLASAFRVHGIPHVVAIRNGRGIVYFTGLIDEASLNEFFARLQPNEAEKQFEAAVAAEKTDPKKAIKLYRLSLKAEPNNDDAIIGLARLLVGQKKKAEAAELLERIPPNNSHSAEAEKLRAILWLQCNGKGAADEAKLRKKAANGLCDLGCALAAQGKTTEALDTLLQAGQLDREVAETRVKETMVKIFHVVGVRSEIADAYRAKLTKLLV